MNNSGWKTKTIGELCDLMTGGTPSRAKKEYFNNGTVNWLVSGDINKRIITECDNRITELGLKNSNAKYLPVNSVLIALNGQGKTRGMVAMLKIKATCNQSLVSIYPKNIQEIIPEYIFYFLESKYEEIRKLTGDTGNDRRGLNMPIIRKIEIPYPPLHEQARIVKILDEAIEKLEKVKENTERNLQKSKLFFESYLSDVYSRPKKGWKKLSLGEISRIMGGKRVPQGYKLLDKITRHPYIRVSDFSGNGSVNLSNIKYIDDDIFKQIQRYTISSNDMYMSIAGTIGKTGIIPTELDGANLTENACKLVFNENIDPKFVYFFTRSSDFKNQAGLNTRIAAMPKLALSRLSTISLNIPLTISEQKKIVKVIDSIQNNIIKVEENYSNKISNLVEFKESILTQAFSGNL